MPRWVAFLRAINVGGHTVSMARLRELFAGLGLRGVETFIASGNVIFEAPGDEAVRLERRIERHLAGALGYPVETFIRPTRELPAIAAHQPFRLDGPGGLPGTVYVGFLRGAPDRAARRAIQAFNTDVDEFDVKGREVYWLVRGRLADSKVKGAALGRVLGPTTMRNRNTIVRLAGKYALEERDR
jgi:uncharacterized protein (DUF1697 family)